MKVVANNKKARHDYFIEETYEAGITLTGTEIKSVRQSRVSLKESYARIEKEEVFLYGMNISPYDKRHDIAKRDADRRMQQAMRKHS